MTEATPGATRRDSVGANPRQRRVSYDYTPSATAATPTSAEVLRTSVTCIALRRRPPFAEVIPLDAEKSPGQPGTTPSAARTSWRLSGVFLAVVLISIPAYLENATSLLDRIPEIVVWVPAVTGAVGSALASVYLERTIQPSDDVTTGDERQGTALPPPLAHFVGYNQQLAAIRRILRRFPRPGWRGFLSRRPWRAPGAQAAPPVIVITGGPGIGKSQLANHVAREFSSRFPDGVRWVEMHGDAATHEPSELEGPEDVTSDPAPSSRRITSLLALIQRRRDNSTDAPEVPDGGRRGSRIPRTQKSLLSELINWLSDTPRTQPSHLSQTWWNLTDGKRLLLVLDNTTSGDKVRALLPNSSGSAVIVTSPGAFDAARLHYEEIALNGFTNHEGMELLERIAPNPAVMDDRYRENSRRWRIVELSYGLPLALGFCGSILKQPMMRDGAADHQSASEGLLRQLENAAETPIIHDPSNGFLSSFRAAFHECTARQRLLLRRMAVTGFEEASDVTAAALLGVRTSDTAALLSELSTRFLLEPLGLAADGIARYRLPELIAVSLRELDTDVFDLTPAEQAAWSVERTQEATRRLLVAYCYLAESAARVIHGSDDHFPQPERIPLPEVGILEIAPLDHPQRWLARDRHTLQRCLDTAEDLGHIGLQWRTSHAVAQICQVVRAHWDEWDHAVRSERRAAEHLQDQQLMAIALLDNSEIRANQGQYEGAAHLAREARAICVESRLDPRWGARADRALGISLHRKGETGQALVELETAALTFTEHGESWWHARTQANLGDLQDHLSDHDRAEELLRTAIALFQETNDTQQRDLAQLRLAEVLANRGAALRAWVLLQEVLERTDPQHQQWYRARCLRALGSLDSRSLNSQYADFLAGRTQWDLDMTQRAQQQLHTAAQSAARTRFRRRSALTGFSVPSQLTMLRESAGLQRRMGDQWGLHWTTLTLGLLQLRRQQVPEGQKEVLAAANGFAQLEDHWWFARTHRFAAQEIVTMLLRDDTQATYGGSDPDSVRNIVASSPWRQQMLAAAREHAETALTTYGDTNQDVGVLLTKILLVRIDRAAGNASPEDLRARLVTYGAEARDRDLPQVEREVVKWQEWLRSNRSGTFLEPNH